MSEASMNDSDARVCSVVLQAASSTGMSTA